MNDAQRTYLQERNFEQHGYRFVSNDIGLTCDYALVITETDNGFYDYMCMNDGSSLQLDALSREERNWLSLAIQESEEILNFLDQLALVKEEGMEHES